MKKIFNLEITEKLCKRVSIEADSLEEAVKELERMYSKSEIVLEADDFEDYLIKEVK